MAISINTLVEDITEFENNLGNKFVMLWNTLLDDTNGISKEAYDRLVILGNMIDPKFVSITMAQKSATIACLHNNKLLLLRRGPTAKWNAGKYCLPGGKLESGETLKDCALRELYEETNILTYRDNLTPIVIDYEKYTKTVFVTDLNSNIVTLNWEHDHYVWVTLSETFDMSLVPSLRTTIKTLEGWGYLI